MPFVSKPFPTLPSLTVRMDVRWDAFNPTGSNVQFACTSFHWVASSGTHAGWSKSAWGTAFFHWWNSIVTDWWATGTVWWYSWLFFNDAGVNRSITPGTTFPGPSHGTYSHFCLSPCFSKITTVPGRNGKGRSILPPIPAGFLAGGRFTPTAYATLQIAAARFLAPVVDQGITYRPAVYFPSLLSTIPITSVHVPTVPTFCYRRRDRAHSGKNIYVYPIVG